MESKITTNAMDLPSSCHSKMDDVMEQAIAAESYSIADISGLLLFRNSGL